MIRIDHLARDDYECHHLLNYFVIDFDDELCVDSTAPDSDQSNFRLYHTCDCQCPQL